MRRILPILLLSGAASACAAIWGFHDALDLPDGGESAGELADAANVREVTSTTDTDEQQAYDAGASGPDASNAAPVDSGEAIDSGQDVCATCAPAAPAGWSGPFELYELDQTDGGDAGGLPSCGQESSSWTSALDLHALPNAAPAACTCTCSAPSGGTCSTPAADFFSDGQCKTSCSLVPSVPVASACTELTASGSGCPMAHFELSTTLATPGACGASGVASLAPWSWQVTARLCSPSTDAGDPCGNGTCLPPRDSAFENAYCIIHTSLAACPAASYPARRGYDVAGDPYFAGATDLRACTPCGCEPAAGSSCTLDAATSTSMFGGACSDLTPYSGCTNVGEMPTFATATSAPSGGACASTLDGGQPTGSVQPMTPYTICCTQ